MSTPPTPPSPRRAPSSSPPSARRATARQGEGTIGPNLTDEFWLHGADPEAVWTSIAEGFPTAGMPPMKDQLGEQERAQVMAFVYSLQGTSPPNPKEPQGERTPVTL